MAPFGGVTARRIVAWTVAPRRTRARRRRTTGRRSDPDGCAAGDRARQAGDRRPSPGGPQPEPPGDRPLTVSLMLRRPGEPRVDGHPQATAQAAAPDNAGLADLPDARLRIGDRGAEHRLRGQVRRRRDAGSRRSGARVRAAGCAAGRVSRSWVRSGDGLDGQAPGAGRARTVGQRGQPYVTGPAGGIACGTQRGPDLRRRRAAHVGDRHARSGVQGHVAERVADLDAHGHGLAARAQRGRGQPGEPMPDVVAALRRSRESH